MADLTHKTATTLIERAIYNAVNYAYRKRLPAAATVAALRAVATRGSEITPGVYAGYQRTDHDLIYCTAQGVCYEWSTATATADNGDTVVKPTDAGTTGRWLKTSSTVQTGYLQDVRLYEGEQTEREFLERIVARLPAVAIRWKQAGHTPKSQIAGALYRHDAQFDLLAGSSNMRGGPQPEAVVGSAIVSEASVDPGGNAIIGDLKHLFSGLTGEELNQPGISYCEIGDETPVWRSLAERRFVFGLDITVHATVHKTDEQHVPGVSVPLTEIDVTFQIPTE